MYENRREQTNVVCIAGARTCELPTGALDDRSAWRRRVALAPAGARLVALWDHVDRRLDGSRGGAGARRVLSAHYVAHCWSTRTYSYVRVHTSTSSFHAREAGEEKGRDQKRPRLRGTLARACAVDGCRWTVVASSVAATREGPRVAVCGSLWHWQSVAATYEYIRVCSLSAVGTGWYR